MFVVLYLQLNDSINRVFVSESREQIEELHRKLMEAKRVRLDLENTTDITVSARKPSHPVRISLLFYSD